MSGYPLTLDQLEEGHLLVLGTTGSGKTYQLRGMIEQLRRADRRVGAIDKLGNHWGLTTSADGARAGLEFFIFGGKRGQLPMTPDQGEQLGRLFVERNIPAIFDVSQWRADEQQQWVADFADAVFRYNEGALALALDEMQSWTPQGGGGEAFRPVQRLAEQGRGNGVRLLMSCQRLSRLDATVRGMAHLVVAMRQTSTIDRKAVADLVASDKTDLQLLEELPRLKTGTGFLWDPAKLGLERISFPSNTTFDSSRTPRHGDTPPAPIVISSALVDELREALAPAATAAAKSAGDAYHAGQAAGEALIERDRRIAELEDSNAQLQADVVRYRFIAKRALTIADRQNKDLGELLQVLQPVRDANMHSGDADMHLPSSGAQIDVKAVATAAKTKRGATIRVGSPSPIPAPASARVTADAEGGSAERTPAAGPPRTSGAIAPRLQSIVDWLAWTRAVYGEAPVRRELLAMILNRHPRSKGFLNDLGELRGLGLVDYPQPGTLDLTDSGRAAENMPSIAPTLKGVREAVAQLLQPAQRKIFDIVVATYPDAIARDDIAERLALHPRTKTLLNNVGRLSSLGLVTYSRPGQLRAADFLMRRAS